MLLNRMQIGCGSTSRRLFDIGAYEFPQESPSSGTTMTTSTGTGAGVTSGSPLSGSGSGGGCFIATACFGTPMSKEVIVLTRFRDSKLLPTSLGRAFIEFYYKTSPPIASYLKKNEHAAWLVRQVLKAIAFLIELTS